MMTETASQYYARKNDEFWKALNAHSHEAPRRKKRKKPEAKVQKEIIQWLLARKVVLAVTDAGALQRMGVAAGCGVPKGWPDLTCCFPGGVFVGIECKAPKGVQSEAQKTAEFKITAIGGLYILAPSLEGLIEALKKEKILGNIPGFPLDD